MKIKAWLFLFPACLALLLYGIHHRDFQARKDRILALDPSALEALGSHLVLGYHSLDEVLPLIDRKLIAGVFVTRRNVKGKTWAEMEQEISILRTRAEKAGIADFLISTDQEGGLVAKLKPLVPSMPSMGSLIEKHGREDGLERIAQESKVMAEDMARLGFNLNLAPISDLKMYARPLLKDRHSRIPDRAVSDDPLLVGDAGAAFCRSMEGAGIRCTLKHFPGLGRVRQDTHVTSALLPVSLADWLQTDWKAFEKGLTPSSFIMIGHVVFKDVDAALPASLSPKVMDLLRTRLGVKNPVITDDLSMGPTMNHPGGVGVAALDSLKAGVDYLLISYNPDLIYTIIETYLKSPDKSLVMSRASSPSA